MVLLMVDTAAFEAFWKAYPRHVGKLAALKAYAKARTIATAEEILAGVEVYKRMKPAYCDWAHASTWLNAGRWMDEYDAKVPANEPAPVDWFSECKQLHGGACGLDPGLHARRKLIDAAKVKSEV